MTDNSKQLEVVTSNLVAQLREDLGDGAMVLLVGDGRKYDPLRLKAADEIERLMSFENGVLGLMYECRDALVLDDQHAELYQRVWKWCQERQCKGSSDETTTPHLLDQFTEALKADPDLAWSWHCNLAMPIMDRVKCSHTAANEAAADLMRHLFHIDIRSNSCWAITVRPEEPTPCPKCKAPDSGECPCSPDEQWSAVKATALRCSHSSNFKEKRFSDDRSK